MQSTIKMYLLVGISIFFLTDLINPQSGISPNYIERAGQSGWQFLKINGDARQAALGGAFTAISNGNASSIFGNPASLSDVKNIDVQVNVMEWVADISYQSLAFAYNLDEWGVVGASIAMLNYGDIPETINASTGTSGTIPIITGKMFTANDIAAGISYSKKITENLSVGGNVRWMQQKIAELSMQNWSLDFGTIYYTGLRSLRIAITARNFGPDSRFGGWSEEYHLGVSYAFDGTFFVRGGYKFNYDVQKFTFGAGVTYPIGGTIGTINYAYVDFGELTQVHMFSLGF